METIYRAPGLKLKPFITFLWASSQANAGAEASLISEADDSFRLDAPRVSFIRAADSYL